MILCASCQTENREGASFCLTCGAKLEQSSSLLAEPPLDDGCDPSANALEGITEEVAVEAPTEHDVLLEPEREDEQTLESEPVAPPAVEGDPDGPADLETAQNGPEPVRDLEPEADLEEEINSEGELSDVEAGLVELPSQDEPDLEAEESVADDQSIVAAELPPLEPGTMLNERFEIVALLEENTDTLLYDALDHRRCAQCGFADSLPDDLYCANCGALLEGAVETPHVQLRALRLAGEAIIQLEEENEGRIECWLEANGQLFAVLPLPTEEPEDEPTPFERGVRHVVGYNSDVGLQRELDEDALLSLTLAPVFESESRPSLGLYAVADGMGGHEGGEVASRTAVEGLAEIISTRLFLPELGGDLILPETPTTTLTEAVQTINSRIYNLQQATGSDMGTTLTAAMIRGDQALIANVGDSRTYLWRDGELSQLTVDHSLVAQLVAAEMIEPHEIYNHPEKSAIYRSLGHLPDVEVDVFPLSLLPGDRLLLCCDGVWEMLRDEGLEEVLLSEVDPQRASSEIVRRSNLAGGEDNISVVIVLFEEL